MSTGMAATGPHVLRRMNATAVLAALRGPGTARVADLVTATGLSRPAVGRALSALGESGLVEFVGQDSAQPGRPAVLVRFRAESGYVAGVDIGPHKVLALVADLSGRVLASHRAAVPDGADGPELTATVRSALTAAADAAGCGLGGLWAVCAGSPGIVDHDRGEVLLAPSIPGWAGLPLAAELRDWLGCPVLLDNDATLAVLAERWHGDDVDSLIFVQWGERIGTGIVIDGKPYRGHSCAAGELGFVDLADPDSPGARPADGMGPFERLVGAGAIRDLAVAAGLGRDLGPLFDAAAGHDPTALAVVDKVAARFARGLATMLLLLDPQRVVIGGGVSRAGDVLLDAVREHLAGHVLVPVDVRAATTGEQGVALGAVRHALDSVEHRLSG